MSDHETFALEAAGSPSRVALSCASSPSKTENVEFSGPETVGRCVAGSVWVMHDPLIITSVRRWSTARSTPAVARPRIHEPVVYGITQLHLPRRSRPLCSRSTA